MPFDIYYTNKTLLDLSESELRDLKRNLDMGRVICPTCSRWTDNLVQLPDEYIPYFQRENIWFTVSNEIPSEVCSGCISKTAARKQEAEAKEYQIKKGIIQIAFDSRRDERYEKGFVYLCKYEGVFKIGATTQQLALRLSQNGCGVRSFIWAIETHLPFTLEHFIHTRLKEKRKVIGKMTELFDLGDNEIAWIKSIKSVNGTKVKHYDNLKAVT